MATKKQNSVIPKEISWEAPHYQIENRSPSWYLVFGLASIIGIGFAIFYERSITTVITFGLIIVLVFLLASQPQRKVHYKIGPMGLSAGRTLYPMAVVKKFWIDYNPPEVKTLNFETTAYLNNKAVFQLGDVDPNLVQMVAKQYLAEDVDHVYNFRETLAKKLKL